MRKIYFCFSWWIFIGLSGCLKFAGNLHSGIYMGMNGSNQFPAPLKWTISLTGDGFINGIWESSGNVKAGRLSGKTGLWRHEISLIVTEGDCLGEFKGLFTAEDGRLRGELKDNAQCPDRVYLFELHSI